MEWRGKQVFDHRQPMVIAIGRMVALAGAACNLSGLQRPQGACWLVTVLARDPKTFSLPPAITELLAARNRLREHYKHVGLEFTLDGNLVGDIGEALAAELFGLRLESRSAAGIDGFAADGRSVQVKASGPGRGPAFRMVETQADHLLFFSLDFEACSGVVTFNGPERLARQFLPVTWLNQRSLSLSQMRRADSQVEGSERLQRLV